MLWQRRNVDRARTVWGAKLNGEGVNGNIKANCRYIIA